jgi:hypothetical protein
MPLPPVFAALPLSPAINTKYKLKFQDNYIIFTLYCLKYRLHNNKPQYRTTGKNRRA